MKKLQVQKKYPQHRGVDTAAILDLMFYELGKGVRDETIVDYEASNDKRGLDFRLSTICMKPREHANIALLLRRLRDRYPSDTEVTSLLLLFGGYEDEKTTF